MTDDMDEGTICSVCGIPFEDEKTGKFYSHGYHVMCWDCWDREVELRDIYPRAEVDSI